MYGLDGKVALVTGAGGKRGIGRAVALRLAREGADVVVNDLGEKDGSARRENSPTSDEWGGLPQVIDEIRSLGRRSMGVWANVAIAQQVQKMVDQVVAEFGRIDIFVSNAGTKAGNDRVAVVDLAEEDWDRVQNVNIKGTFLCCQAVARQMLTQEPGGKIITMSSTSGKRGTARFAAYCSSKFAVIGFTQVLAHELAPHNVQVNAICPGLVETERVLDMATALGPDTMTPAEYREVMIKRANDYTPAGRIAQPEDVADIAAFLASSQSDYMTGLSFPVAGGSYMQ
ncbi:3-oxoacyl-ACP reductase FabG [Chloroflexi bacterium TSY]|nr:3-oxoacyl-ACP reductase FabG [Chloroflexi bacterium TSY]